jgi:DMSO/TMAO reductase YedYZ molybdopterin-dependent catalytic subunit
VGTIAREKKEKNVRRVNPGILTLLLIGVVLAACSRPTLSTELESAEIREYQGEDLSSINDFRENSIKGPQHVSLDDYTLEVTGLVEKPLSLTYEEVLDHDQYSKVVTLYCVEGWDAKILWEGVLIRDLIDQAGAKSEANTVIFHAEDGYTSSLPLGFVRENDILLAHKMNGVTLPPERGFPFQVVAESKWGYKWVKWVTQIELSDDPDYKGYWEERGYNNDGDVEGPIFKRP